MRTPLGLFSVLWALGACLHHLEGQPLAGLPLYPFALLLMVFPERLWALALFAAVHGALLFLDFPAPANHSVLAWLVELCLLIGMAGLLRGAGDRRRRLWDAVRGPLMATVAVTYFFAVFHKLNRSFFDPEVSCATTQVVKMLWVHGFPEPSGSLAPLAFNIYLTLAWEAVILVLLLRPRWSRLGAFLGLVFHTGLAWARFYDFATVVFALYLFFLPWDEVENALRRIPLRAGRVFAAGALVLAGTSFWFLGIRKTPTILSGNPWSLQAETVMCLAWTILIWPVLLPVFRGPAPRTETTRWAGAALAWAVPLLAFLNGATPYLGLKTVSNYSMFSNLRTEGGITNHLFIPAGRFFVTEDQNDLVRVHLFAADPPERWPLWVRLAGGERGLERNARWMEEIPEARVPMAELRRTVQLWKRAGYGNPTLLYQRGGELAAPHDPYGDPDLMRPLSWWRRTFLAWRAVQADGEPSECRW